MTQIAPATVRQRVGDAGAAGFHSLTGYVRATSVVALVDAVGIGTGLAIMGIPLALPLASLVFLGALRSLSARCCPDSSLSWLRCSPRIRCMRSSPGLIIAVMQLEAHVYDLLVMWQAGIGSPVGCRARSRSRRCPRRCGGTLWPCRPSPSSTGAACSATGEEVAADEDGGDADLERPTGSATLSSLAEDLSPG